ncbi:myosin light chain kinase 2, skeletal/cardiac muscle isoform X2 [Acipenser ruthenus]|uniref:myosin light chain kinase 2, skeletal/cardiac muscle isoform X2 n=1 Tax=Acipenser ruthenus TaxID=7906 RepID=UPI00145AAF29|nr:myosin light chain kinase 2, skeletal/cardiac muscle isoform X2 [Acipenser ruthenus]
MSTQVKQNSTLVHSMAKVYDTKPMKNQGPNTTTGTTHRLAVVSSKNSVDSSNLMDIKIDSLSRKVDKLITIQEKVLHKLDSMSEDIVEIENDVEILKVDKEETIQASSKPQEVETSKEIKEICVEMTNMLATVNRRTEHEARRLDGMEKIVLGIQQVISFIGETVKNSRILELILKGQVFPNWSPVNEESVENEKNKQISAKKHASSDKSATVSKKTEKLGDHKAKDIKEKPRSSLKRLKSQQKKKPPDATGAAQKKDWVLDEKVQKLNKQNVEKSEKVPLPQEKTQVVDEEDLIWQSAAVHTQTQELLVAVTSNDLANTFMSVCPAEEGKQEMVTTEVNSQKKQALTSLVSGGVGLEDVVKKGQGDLKETSKTRDQEEGRADKEAESLSDAELDEEDGDQEGDDEQEETEAEETTEADEVSPTDESAPETCLLEGADETENGLLAETQLYEILGGINQNCSVMLQRYEDSENEVLLSEETGGEQASETGHLGDTIGSKRRVSKEDLVKDDNKKSRVESESEEPQPEEILEPAQSECVAEKTNETCISLKEDNNNQNLKLIIDIGPPPPAPFDHRVVSAKPAQIINFYTLNKNEILGGGRFGQVHKCVENSSGLTLAAKIIKVKCTKEKEEVKNEIQVMNQLNHANLIQLYAAFESKNDLILVMEYVDGGELFDRIIDENYYLTELDTVLFIKQICDGVQYMHQMYILHLDLKPENILCVNRATNKIKIIDFGLARRYKPREKLKVNFGTAEFLAPEVVNYDFVSFPTDMWSLGVITYMLLSGLSPFLGEDDNETLNNILACQWDFEGEEFGNISEEAKDFISKLLIKNKCWRISAAEALKHPWLSDPCLHFRLQQQNKCHSSHAPPSEE